MAAEPAVSLEGADTEAFEQIVAAHVDVLRKYAARHVARSAVDQDDALQEALIRLWREWSTKGLPADPSERLSYMLRAVRCAARDAVRRHHREGSARDRVVPADLQLAESHAAGDEAQGTAHYGAVTRAIHRDAAAHNFAEQLVERDVLLRAIAKLDELELRVICGIGEGTRYDVLASELGVTKAQVNNAANRARTLLVGLIDHASGTELARDEREQLVALMNGEIRDRTRRRIAQRHFDNCALCQEVAKHERNVVRAAAAVFAPLSALLAAKPLTAATAGATAGSGIAPFGSATAPMPLPNSGAVIGAIGSKLAAATALVAVAAGGSALLSSPHSGAPHSAPPRRAVHARRAGATALEVNRGSQATRTRSRPAVSRETDARRNPRASTRRANPQTTQRAGAALSPAVTAKAAATVPTATARPLPAPTPSAPPHNTSGGEFVVGGNG